ncbi:transcriptional regulator family: Fungal Specific TF [Penicillium roqueforti]|uniref:Zn(2)-C6 fungal-type DNA-binding domain n=1 Tax=Penicillium roqueforti (strain FM164) TaxID=1365484 RepID=W6QPR7_PENRF|nr:transcriptional regulator family: Fungal Specific TF [Penicillium roqueforti]CDM37991.1 Zn(2)-C6 fungal-type DNA-binding domain [Penicillium roqueforti FM164]KAF9249755.1 transcriptional regulator family: Fungal Specific TF [Penicillium roqueforti]KAI1829843.1 transcriptional regulator family: Fungal Specific TF [Penicillium roqueforti]KAI2669898.1 transcriptional regulator family: Fungal Specific TF [Penicillium roqueforti]KAI2685015.1 transcriptional regulator family: Fungal Specific TF [
MPRPKVHPANRLRANTACTACRASKKRCSGYFPCTNCIHKGCGRSCTPFKSLSHAGLRSPLVPASRPTVEAPRTRRGVSVESQSLLTSQSHDIGTPRVEPDTPEVGSHSPEVTHRTHPRMLRNLQGERVYVGKAASLSFLQLLRDTVTQHIGPSQFSHNGASEDMLETEAHHDLLNFSGECCTVAEKERFIQNYHAATSGFFNLSFSDDVSSSFIDPAEPKTDREKTRAAIMDLMVAIGAQSSPNDREFLQVERFYFSRGQRRTFANMLEDPSVDLVRVFLLMSFYMLGACRRNTAFMYLGVASRAAVALGFHAEFSGSISPDESGERNERSRLWMSLCILDLLVSSILGRPSAISPLLPENRQGPSWGAAPSDPGLVASYQLSLILDKIINCLYSDKAASAQQADLLLCKLNGWGEYLPSSLRTSSLGHQDQSTFQEHTIGNMHVACSYHFAVILVTRPFLVSALSVRLARLHQSLSTGDPSEVPEEDPAHSRLAAACIDSAVYMLQTCLEVHKSGLLLRNMCILKAFIFAAALVLGFSMFSHRDVDSEIDEVFCGALTILRMLAPQSAQAAHYLEIITKLEAAISKQRQQLATQARQRRSQYVSRIFSMNDSPATPRTPSEGNEEEANTTPHLSQSVTSNGWLDSNDSAAAVSPPMIEGTLFDWEGMNLPLWDSFPFLAESTTI